MSDVSTLNSILNVLIIVVAITFITRRVRIPYTIALILAGLFFSTTSNLPFPSLSPNTFLIVLLPPILFEAAIRIDVDALIKDADVVISYASVGTILTITAVALFAYFLLGFSPIESTLIGIIVAPTDPIAVITSFVRGGVNDRLRLFVEGESLFNDGVALVGFTMVLDLINRGGGIDLAEIFRISVVSVMGGAIVGYAGGYAIHRLIEWSDDKFAEILLTFLLSFGAYQFAEELRASGVIATVVAGLVLSDRFKKFGGISKESYSELSAFWGFVGFIATSLAFIFIGIYSNLELIGTYILPILGLAGFILITRYAKIFVIAKALEKYRHKRISGNWLMGLWWSGLRGAISVVLVLSISSLPIYKSEEIVALVFGVVLATNLILGLSLPWAISNYKLANDEPPTPHNEAGKMDASVTEP